MKGSVVAVWMNTIETLHGKEMKYKAMESVGWNPSRIISPLDDIKDKEIFTLIEYVATETNQSVEDLWKKIGRANIRSFHKWFPSFFERSTLKGFLTMMDNVHAQLTKMIKGATPPRMIPEEIDGQNFFITYRSKRGMVHYLMGLLEGAADFFNEKMTYDVVEHFKESDGTTVMKLKIWTEKSTSEKRAYRLNKVLSLGVLKSIPLKLALAPTLLVLATTFVLDASNLPLNLGLSAGVFLITALVGRGLIAPTSLINEEIRRMGDVDLEKDIRVSTADEFEKIFRGINDAKQEMRTDFVYFKGGVDDLYSFNEKFKEVAGNLSRVADTISSSVHEVAEGANHQAIETEKSVSILSENIETLNILSKEELERKDALEVAVQNIETSFNELSDISSNLTTVRENFSKVNDDGKALSEKIDNIKSIVSAVEQIAEQTNLLALNASIEAARAGEMGRGFSVVAEEIRKLAEDSKDAVSTINQNLVAFTQDVNQMVHRVSEQYEDIDHSSRTMNTVAENNRQATNQIKDVAQSIVEISEKLTLETDKISNVFENMHTLAAIAEENSASSQEMSASVQQFTGELHSFDEYIGELEKLAKQLRDEMKKFKL